jgi:PAS domain S-box-containing protein
VTRTEHRAPPSESIDLERALSDRFHADAAKGVIGHPIVALVLAFLVRDEVDQTLALALVVVISAAALVRIRLHRAAASREDPRAVVAGVRSSTAVVAAAWAAAAFVLLPLVSPAVEGRILMVFAGLVSAGVVTHEADPRGFDLFTGILLGSALIGLFLGGMDAIVGVDVLFVVAFWAMMTVLNRHLHGELRTRMSNVKALEEASAKVTAAEAAYGNLVESASDLIWRVDAHGTWEFVNRAALDIYGMEPDHLVGTPALDRAGESTASEVFGRVLGGEHVRNQETVHRTPAGELRHLSFSASPILDDTGDIVGAQGTARDVTDQARARGALEALADQTRLLKSVINATEDLIFYKDASGTYQGLNEAFATVAGRPADEILGKTDHDLYPPDRASSFLDLHERVMRTGEPAHFEEWIDVEGTPRLLSTVKTAIRGPDGQPVGTLGMVRDTTRWKETEKELLALAQEAERANRMKSEFLANMSHEIRTPMNGVLGMTELVLDSELSDEQREYLRIAASSARDLLHIVDDILDLSKIEAGEIEIHRQPFDLAGVLAQSTRVMAARAEARNNALALDVDPDVSGWFEGDPFRLRQVVTNLVGNAVKFTEGGNIVVAARRLEESEPSDGGPTRVRVEVMDHGIGIRPEDLEHIFDEFRQADSSISRKYGGTGLGLTICRRLVGLMGGTMGVESVPGRGSTFWFELPLTPSEPMAPEVNPVDETLFRDRRILVVGENAINRRILTGVYDDVGAEVTSVESGADGLQALERARESGKPIELVVTPLHLARMDGVEFVERVRSSDGADTPILVLAPTQGDGADKARLRELGVLGIQLTPLTGRELLFRSERAFTGPTEEEEAPETRQPIEGALSPRPTGRNLRVLLAEDVAVNRQVALAVLGRLGYDVEWVEDGGAAVEAALEGGFDAILMDIQMPEMDGLEATRILRRDPRTRTVPIIALTAHALPAERQKCLDAGMDDFVTKPFRARTLARAIERWTGAHGRGAGHDASDEDSRYGAAGVPIDVDALRASMEEAGIPEAVDGLISVFRDDLPRRRAAIEAALASEAATDVAAAAHALKSAAGSVHAVALHRALQALEVGAQEGQPTDELGAVVLRRIDELGAFLAAVDDG